MRELVFTVVLAAALECAAATATGFFHFETLDGSDRAIDPDGRAIMLAGVDFVNPDVFHSTFLGYAPYARFVATNYPSRQAWAEETAARLTGASTCSLRTARPNSSPDSPTPTRSTSTTPSPSPRTPSGASRRTPTRPRPGSPTSSTPTTKRRSSPPPRSAARRLRTTRRSWAGSSTTSWLGGAAEPIPEPVFSTSSPGSLPSTARERRWTDVWRREATPSPSSDASPNATSP